MKILLSIPRNSVTSTDEVDAAIKLIATLTGDYSRALTIASYLFLEGASYTLYAPIKKKYFAR